MSQRIIQKQLLPSSNDPKSLITADQNHKKRKEFLWSQEENEIYIRFLKENRSQFKTEKARRNEKVFTKLEKLLENRTAQQCRGHHQRMIITHKSITKTIKYLEKGFKKIIETGETTLVETEEKKTQRKDKECTAQISYGIEVQNSDLMTPQTNSIPEIEVREKKYLNELELSVQEKSEIREQQACSKQFYEGDNIWTLVNGEFWKE